MKKNVFDPDFGTAVQALRAIRAGAISSRELTRHVFKRIGKYNEKINAFVTLNEEEAMKRARKADSALAAGKNWGPLHGLPILIKDQYRTAGLRTTCGFPHLADYVPKENAVAVDRLLNAGAIIVGKTNTPIGGGDIQTYNRVAGTTNNPWDVTKTSGGSTGGGAAALAAGFGFLELGGDLAGSIRTPGNFCGVCGHKSTLNLVPLQGSVPPLPGKVDVSFNLAGLTDLTVAGPLARSVADLKLELGIIAGPAPEDAVSLKWALPKPRKEKLKDYRIGFVIDDPFCPVDPDIRAIVSRSVDALRREGVKVVEGWPEGIKFSEVFDAYFKLLTAYLSPSPIFSESVLEKIKSRFDEPYGDYERKRFEGLTMSHKDWYYLSAFRHISRLAWREYFKEHDAFLMPANCVAAFPHTHDGNMYGRVIESPDRSRYYGEAFKWISVATLAGCPATVVPAGRTKTNLPVGVQIMGPYMEDGTSLDLAMKLESILGGFTPPPGFKE